MLTVSVPLGYIDIPAAVNRALKNPNFRRWFDGSKVVDSKGRPLVVYHGTTALEPFTVFNIKYSDFGAHFSPCKDIANSFARASSSNILARPRVYPVFLRIKHPLRLTDKGQWWAIIVLDEMKAKHVIDEQEYNHVIDEIADKILEAEDALVHSNKIVQSFIKSKGYDGIVYLNRRESATGGILARDIIPSLEALMDKEVSFDEAQNAIDNMSDEQIQKSFPGLTCDCYIIFDPAQAKSIFNKGTFDPNDPDIMK